MLYRLWCSHPIAVTFVIVLPHHEMFLQASLTLNLRGIQRILVRDLLLIPWFEMFGNLGQNCFPTVLFCRIVVVCILLLFRCQEMMLRKLGQKSVDLKGFEWGFFYKSFTGINSKKESWDIWELIRYFLILRIYDSMKGFQTGQPPEVSETYRRIAIARWYSIGLNNLFYNNFTIW